MSSNLNWRDKSKFIFAKLVVMVGTFKHLDSGHFYFQAPLIVTSAPTHTRTQSVEWKLLSFARSAIKFLNVVILFATFNEDGNYK